VPIRSSLLESARCWLAQRRLRVRPWSELAGEKPLQGASLAIVGNAGYLADLRQGPHIDSHDLVLRMNNFAAADLESHVGRRLDIFMSTFYRDVRLDDPRIAAASYLIASVPNNLRKRGLNWRHGQAITQALEWLSRTEIFVPSCEHFETWRKRIGRYPTTGAMALLLALEHLLPVCGAIYVTGFSFFTGRSHYFSDQQVSPTNHAPDRERQWFAELLQPHWQSGRITLDPHLTASLGFRTTHPNPLRGVA
jgi:hypothetical protein